MLYPNAMLYPNVTLHPNALFHPNALEPDENGKKQPPFGEHREMGANCTLLRNYPVGKAAVLPFFCRSWRIFALTLAGSICMKRRRASSALRG